MRRRKPSVENCDAHLVLLYLDRADELAALGRAVVELPSGPCDLANPYARMLHDRNLEALLRANWSRLRPRVLAAWGGRKGYAPFARFEPPRGRKHSDA